jgi:uncharacterized protein YdeI (YjbR/CyaY-like superfamily)
MKLVHASTRAQWRRWLAENHDKEAGGIWLVFHRKETGKPALDYEAAVEEALCVGWIDSVIKKLDDERYCRRFTPRKDGSVWSEPNKRRAEKMVRAGRMTAAGLAKVEAAKRLGRWATDPRPVISPEVPQDLAAALARNRKARSFFDTLAPSCRKQFIGWIVTAKQSETRVKRVRESLALLARGGKLGLK